MRTRVAVVGRGKLGRALARAIRSQGSAVVTLSARAVLRGRRLPARVDLLVVASRDGQVPAVAAALASAPLPRAAVHVAGALPQEALSPLAALGVSIGVLHPAISVANGVVPELAGAAATVSGDPLAVRLASTLGRALGLRVLSAKRLDRPLYHAACALLANGAAALAWSAAEMFEAAGLSPRASRHLAVPLLGSVVRNLSHVGLPGGLTGPVRRGDVDTLRLHLAAVERAAPGWRPLLAQVLLAQLPMARALGEAPAGTLSRIAALAAAAPKRQRKPRKRP